MSVLGNVRKRVIKALGGIALPSSPAPPQAREAATGLIKSVGSGVQWVGSPDFRAIFRLDAVVDPDAEELTRSIALATSAYCYTITMYRASKIAEPPWYLAQDVTDADGNESETAITDHEVIDVISDPSPDFDMQELLALTEIYMLVSGACAWLKQRDSTGRIGRLIPFSGDQARSFSDGDRIYGGFEILTRAGYWKEYAPEDVVYFREINPNSWRKNLSKLDVALATLDLGHQVNRTVRNFMRKAMFPGGVVSPNPEWDPMDDEWEEFLSTIEAWYAGPAAAGKPLVLQGGATFSRAAIPLKELLPSELLDRIEATLGSIYGVAPIVLGWKVGLENSPWSQMSEARISVYEETLIPRLGDLTRKAGRQMLTPEERAAGYKLKVDYTNVSALRADDKARADVAAVMVNDWTRDERRAYTGKPALGPEDSRGDEIGTGAGGGGSLGSLTSLGAVPSGLLTAAEGGSLEGIYLKGMTQAFADVERWQGKQEPSLEWALFNFNTKAAERTWEREVQKILDLQAAQIISLANARIREAKADALDPDSTVEFIEALAQWTREKGERQLAQGLYPLVVSTGTTGVKRAAAMVGVNFAVLEPGLLTYAAEEADFLASVMGETTGRKVAKIVQNRLRAGGLLADLRKDLQESAAFSRWRAQLVARTETTRAWNGAQRRSLSEYERASDETTRVYKTWLNSGDERVRDEHEDAPLGVGGERKRIDEPYSNGLQEPSEPLCRCTQTFDLETVGA